MTGTLFFTPTATFFDDIPLASWSASSHGHSDRTVRSVSQDAGGSGFMVRAGVVPTQRVLLYGAAGIAVTAAICSAVVAGFGMNRVFTGLLAGAVAGIAILVALFGRDAVVLTEGAIYRRTPWHESSIDWDRVRAGRFTLDGDRWSLALDLVGGDEVHGELVLLSIPPVRQPVSGAYDQRKREQVNEIRAMLRRKRVPVTVLPEIAGALRQHWQIAPPTQ